LSYHIGYYHDNYHYLHIEDSNPQNHAKYYLMYVPSETEVYLRLHQQDKRLHMVDNGKSTDNDPTEDGYQYSPASFLLCKMHDNDILENVLKDPDSEMDNNSYFGERSIYINKDMKVKLE